VAVSVADTFTVARPAVFLSLISIGSHSNGNGGFNARAVMIDYDDKAFLFSYVDCGIGSCYNTAKITTSIHINNRRQKPSQRNPCGVSS
jgi:hypothetical protein